MCYCEIKLAHFQDFLSYAVLRNINAAKKENKNLTFQGLQHPSVFVGYTSFYTGFKYVLVGGGCNYATPT